MQYTCWANLRRPIVALAPMDGVTNRAFRQVVKKLNPHVILFSEFTSAEGILRSDAAVRKIAFDPCELPYFVQLFGNKPESFAEVAKLVESQGVSGIDVNMGCPAKKIVHSQHGSALMKDPDAACRIIEAIRKACCLEVSVKTRLGWESCKGLIDFGKRLESAGVSLLTIHGRTYSQAFKGLADWQPIYELKKHLNIPVLGNGDVESYQDGLNRLGNLDGFMIGRHAIGAPWVFQKKSPSFQERILIALEHYQLLEEYASGRAARFEFRKYLSGYIQGFHKAKDYRQLLMKAESSEAFCQMLTKLLDPAFIQPLEPSCLAV